MQILQIIMLGVVHKIEIENKIDLRFYYKIWNQEQLAQNQNQELETEWELKCSPNEPPWETKMEKIRYYNEKS